MHCLKDLSRGPIEQLLARYGLKLAHIATIDEIPYSYWGAPEAGRLAETMYARDDTPIHSLLHEACHFVCMPPALHHTDDIDAGGDPAEENACCYLQILLADWLPSIDRHTLMKDMDAWGYSFRLGSATRWFHEDSEDTLAWLLDHQIITQQGQPTWQLRI